MFKKSILGNVLLIVIVIYNNKSLLLSYPALIGNKANI